MKYKFKEANKMDTAIKRPCSPIQSLEQAFKEMILIRSGKLPKRTWSEFKRELESKK
jgi:hypothetical protein